VNRNLCPVIASIRDLPPAYHGWIRIGEKLCWVLRGVPQSVVGPSVTARAAARSGLLSSVPVVPPTDSSPQGELFSLTTYVAGATCAKLLG